MRTTIHLDDRLFKEIKKLAAESHRTFASVLEEAVRQLLGRREKARATPPVELPVFRGSGLQPGVDLDNTAALFDVMEGRG